MSEQQLVLVTGGSGYFGEVLSEKLRETGYRVRVFDLNDNENRPPETQFIRGDIRDGVAVRSACEGACAVYHNVAQVPLARDKALFQTVNRDGTLRLLEAAADAKVGKVVYTSSSAVFGVPRSNPVTEDTPPAPMEDYGRAKYDGELLCADFIRKGLDVSIIRPRTILGHGRLGIFQILFEWIYQGYNVPVLGKGDNRYQFVHANDLADACVLAGRRPGPAVYNCGADRFGTMREVLENLCAYAQTGSRVVGVPLHLAIAGMNAASALGLSPLGPYHSLMYGRSMYFDIARARAELGWRPLFSNDEMFRDSFDWYRAHRDTVLAGSSVASHHRSAVKQGILNLVRRVLL